MFFCSASLFFVGRDNTSAVIGLLQGNLLTVMGRPQTETSHDFHGIMGMGWLAEKLQFTDSEMRSKIWFGEKPMVMLGSKNGKVVEGFLENS